MENSNAQKKSGRSSRNEVHWSGSGVGGEKPIDPERLLLSICVREDPHCCCRDAGKVEYVCHTAEGQLPLSARVRKGPVQPALHLFKNTADPLCTNEFRSESMFISPICS